MISFLFLPVGVHVITEMCLYSLTINSGVFACGYLYSLTINSGVAVCGYLSSLTVHNGVAVCKNLCSLTINTSRVAVCGYLCSLATNTSGVAVYGYPLFINNKQRGGCMWMRYERLLAAQASSGSKSFSSES